MSNVFDAPGAPQPLDGIRAVFFDAGNTLVHLDVDWIARRLRADGWEMDEEALLYAQWVVAYEMTRMALLKKYSTDADRLTPVFKRMLALAGIPADFLDECARILLEEHKARNLWRIVPQVVRDTLSQLRKRGYILGVISNIDGRLKSLLDSLDMSGHFRCIIDSAVVGIEKPDPGIFHKAVEAAETRVESCVYVGDIYAIDIEGARRAGMTGILIDPLLLHDEFDCPKIGKFNDLFSLLPPLPHGEAGLAGG